MSEIRECPGCGEVTEIPDDDYLCDECRRRDIDYVRFQIGDAHGDLDLYEEMTWERVEV
jgi:hypothetical protein